jgi:hypothetical protein
MTDLDTLRRALRVEQPPTWAARQSLDVDQIITQGRRLRWRRRLAVGGAAVVCVAAAVSGVLAGTSHPGRSAPVPAQRPASPAHVVRHRPPAYPQPTGTSAPTPSPATSRAPRADTTPSSIPGYGSPLPKPSASAASRGPS